MPKDARHGRICIDKATIRDVIARLTRLPLVMLPSGDMARAANTRRARRRGLAGLAGLAPADALWLPRCRSIHTFGMCCSLDLTWLDAAGRVMRFDRAVPPRRLRICLRARSVLETPADGASCDFPSPGVRNSQSPAGRETTRSPH